MRSLRIMLKLYRAAIDRDWIAFKRCCEEDETAVRHGSSLNGNTALHLATNSGSVQLVTDLGKHAGDSRWLSKNNHGDTVLHEVSKVGDTTIAKDLIRIDYRLLNMKNNRGETPLFVAAALNERPMVKLLASKAWNMNIHATRKDETNILHMTLLSMNFETALVLLTKIKPPGESKVQNGMTCLQLLANMPSAFKSGQPMNKLEDLLYRCLPDYDVSDLKKLDDGDEFEDSDTKDKRNQNKKELLAEISRKIHNVWRRVVQGPLLLCASYRRVRGIKKQQNIVLEIMKELVGDMKELMGDKKERAELEKTIIAAASNGIIEIVKDILVAYPQAIEVTNERQENIFHVVVRNRRKDILDHLLDLQNFQSWTVRDISIDGDSILHQAAYHDTHQMKDGPGEALHMQSDIRWFKRVRKLVPPYLLHHRNKENQTAEELFTAEHKQLVEDGGAWLVRTSKVCTIAAVVIGIVAFGCAYAIRSGCTSEADHRLLLKETAFRTFITSDMLSFWFSLTSIVVFLSIMTSNMDEQDFGTSLPLKLTLGLSILFLAVAAMLVAFAAAVELVVWERLQWTAIPVYTCASCPVAFFLALQFPLYLNLWSAVFSNP